MMVITGHLPGGPGGRGALPAAAAGAGGGQGSLLAGGAGLLPVRRRRLRLPPELPRRRLPGGRGAAALVAGRPGSRRPRRPPEGAHRGLRAAELRTLRAVAEAMAPGRFPAASAGAPTAAPGRGRRRGAARGYLAGLPPRRVLVRLALRVFEWLPFPWRFSRASLEARQDFLRRWTDSSSARAADLLLFLKVLTGLGYGNDPRVQRGGGLRGCAASAGGDPLTPLRFGPRRPRARPAGGEECDVAIVGSGAGGAVAPRCSPRPGSTCWSSRRARTWTAAPTPTSRSRRSPRSTATAA